MLLASEETISAQFSHFSSLYWQLKGCLRNIVEDGVAELEVINERTWTMMKLLIRIWRKCTGDKTWFICLHGRHLERCSCLQAVPWAPHSRGCLVRGWLIFNVSNSIGWENGRDGWGCAYEALLRLRHCLSLEKASFLAEVLIWWSKTIAYIRFVLVLIDNLILIVTIMDKRSLSVESISIDGKELLVSSNEIWSTTVEIQKPRASKGGGFNKSIERYI